MSDLGFNKIAGSVLATGLALIGLNEASHALFHVEHHEKAGYFIDVPEAPVPGETVVEEGPRDYFALLSAADPVAGKEVGNKCTQCHSFEPGVVVTGPSLYGVLGRDIASAPGFKYTAGAGSMDSMEGVWDYAKLDHFLQSPKKMVPGTAMNYIGLKKQQDRSNVIAYLRTLTAGEPLPLPAPLPPQAPPAEGATPTDPSAPAQGEAGTPASATPGQPAPGAPTAPPAQPTQPAPH